MRRGLAAAGLIVGLALVGAPPPGAAHPGLPAAVFDRAEVGWASLRDRTPSSLAGDAASFRARGYLAVDVEADFSSGPQAGAIFQSNVDGRANRMEPRMTGAQYTAARTSASAGGLRQVDFETYLEGTIRYYAAVWVEDRENLDTRQAYDLTGDQAQALYEQLRGTHMPVDIDAYQTASGVRYASIWVRNTESLGWVLRRSVTSAQFDEQAGALGSGYRLLGFDSVRNGASQLYAGIWVENRNGRTHKFRRDMTEHQYANQWNRYRDEGYRLVGYERYETGNGWRYAGMWRQNTDRPTWNLRTTVDTWVQNEVDAYELPGMSVAIIRNGEMLYQRGFGYADTGDAVWLDSQHALRLASVSKAVAGVLTMRLVDQGRVAPGGPTRMYVAGLPAHHTHSIQQLVSNRGCVGHYADVPNSIDNRLAGTRYATARAAATELWSLPLVSNCTVGSTNYYSTHGYTILGAALEGATGRPVADLVRDQITVPYGLETLRAEDRNDSTVRRATLYQDDNDKALPDQISWKVLGGGMESSVEDLARFGDLLIRNEILSQSRRNQMWTGTGWGYSYGWNVSMLGGRLRVAKGGSQLGARSYLLMYPNDGLVVAVLSNRDGGRHSASKIADQIGNLILSSGS